MLEMLSRLVFATEDHKRQRFPGTIHNIGRLGAGGVERQLVHSLIGQAKRGHAGQTPLTVHPLEEAGGHYAPLYRAPQRRAAQQAPCPYDTGWGGR